MLFTEGYGECMELYGGGCQLAGIPAWGHHLDHRPKEILLDRGLMNG